MEGVAAGLGRCGHDCFDIEVGPGSDAVQCNGLVGEPDVQRVGVVLGVHRD